VAICWSRCGRHARDNCDQSLAVGVRSSGKVAKAPRTSSKVRPTRWATRINATRRSTSRSYRRWPPAVRVARTRPSLS
jgi:hypothetical protein